MQTSVNPCTAGLAFAGAGILTLGLVSAPAAMHAAVPQSQVQVRLAALTRSGINTALLDTAVALGTVPPPDPAHTAAATTTLGSSASASATASATSVTDILKSVTTILKSVATRILGATADFAVGGLVLVIVPTVWFVLTPITFLITGVGTVAIGCQVTDCFSKAAVNFFTIPFVPTAFAWGQGVGQLKALVSDITSFFTGAAAVPAAAGTKAAAATAAATEPQAPVTNQSDPTRATSAAETVTAPAVGGPRARLARQSATLPAVTSVPSTAPAATAVATIDVSPATGTASATDSTSTSDSSPAKAVTGGDTAKKPASHRVGSIRRN